MFPSRAPYLPALLAENSVESLQALHGRQRPWIYWLSLLATGGALGVLPLIPVEITVRASGLVRPATERTELRAAIGGRIARVLARDNDRVVAGQPLVELTAPDAGERLARNRALQQEQSDLLADLAELAARLGQSTSSQASGDEIPAMTVKLKTPMLIREHARFLAQYEVNRLLLDNARRVYARTSALAQKGIVTRRESEDARDAVTRAAADLELPVQQALAGWQTQLHDAHTALDQLVSEEKRLREELSLAVIRAPVDGNVQGLAGLGAGATVTAGQSFGYVSPDDRLRVETYVTPKDIGLVRVGQPVRLQIDAYPYTQWGLLDGVVRSVGADVAANGNQAAFKVVVDPAADFLRLSNGTLGALRKGMTLTARFVVARRSLLQILYEDASAWLNPQARPSPS